MKKRVKLGVKPQKVSLFKSLIFLLFFVALIGVVSATTYTCTNCSDCNSKIQGANSGDIVQLNTSISNQVGTCIDFNTTDNITFDCLNFNNYIEGDGIGTTDYGIYLSYTGTDNTDNSIIKNCNISKFYFGLVLNIYSSNNTVTNIITNNNLNRGILAGGQGNTLINITSNNNSQYGITLGDEGGSALTNLTVQENGYYDIIVGQACNNLIENVNGSGGRPIEYYNYTTTVENKELSELILCGTDDSTINNITIRGSDTKKNNGICLSRSENVSISNINSSGRYRGIYVFDFGSDIILTNITANGNEDAGIRIIDVYNNKFKNITANNNNYGLHLGDNFGNIIEDITANNNINTGIYFDNSYNNVIINTITNLNNKGIYLYNGAYTSRNNNFTNITSNSNSQYGIYFYANCNNNTINNSRIENNTLYGIYFQDDNPDNPEFNLFYNNIFNNTNNYYNSTTLTNYFNTTKRTGLNILNGLWIGGNYWENWSAPGTGFSETCPDVNSDGICDSSYSVDGQNYDYFPLSASQPTACTSCSDCSTKIQGASTGGTVYLPLSILDYTGTCIDFNGKDNITFDCLGNTIDGDDTGTDYGIYLSTGSSNNTIKNCNISRFGHGIYATTSSNNTLTNIIVNNNSGNGIYLYSSNNSNLTNIIANNNSGNGISLALSSNNIVSNSIASYNRDASAGVYLSNSSNNTLINITANSNYYWGIYLSLSSNNIISNSIVNSTDVWGIEITSSSDNNIISTSIENSGTKGLWIRYSSNNTISNSILNSNQYAIMLTVNATNNTISNSTINYNNYGIYIYQGAKNNNITNSTSQENKYYDLFVNNDSCDNYITSINGSGGRAIEFYNYPATIENKTLSGLFLCNADNSNISNIIIQGSDTLNNNGLSIFSSDNLTLSNINSSNNSIGIDLRYSSNSTLTNITANNNTNGISLSSSNSSTLTNITARNNGRGISLIFSSNNTVSNSIASYNTQWGVYLLDDAGYNTINNSSIEGNSQYGIYFLKTSDYPKYNKVYNNLFNNTNNYYNNTNLTNYFNTTKTNGTNIVGGSYIGGNFWAYPNGSGFSQTCTDANSDGFCDSAYSLDGKNYDYLPLYSASLGCTESWTCTAWSSCVSSVQTRTCTDSNSCGTTTSKPPESQSCTGPSTGGGIVAGQPTQTHTWTTITANEPATMTITNPQMDLTTITITTTETVTGASLTVTKIDVLPQADIEIGLPSGNSYQAFKIDTSGINDTNIANATIEFKVNKTWVDSQGTADQISLYRKPGQANKWDALETTLTGSDEQYYYFSAVSPGFSSFVVFIDLSQCVPGDIRCFNKEIQLCLGNYTWVVTKTCEYGCDGNECARGEGIGIIDTGSIAVYVIITVISAGILVILYFMFRYFSKKHAQEIWKKSQMRGK